ncbi:MAG: alpha/beta hydrolase domain-containing protein [Pseudomonadota bacterium]|nr:alpha/beta hydrolase domain-containing protein [Pseudomonadota bacterium]
MTFQRTAGWLLLLAAALPALLACKPQLEAEYPNAVVSKAPNLGPSFVAGTYFSLAPYDYVEQEYFFRGEARSYVNTAPLTSDGKWSVEPAATAQYNTRMLVYRPQNPEDFNGTVVVEWLNVTGGVDTATDWLMLHNEILRRGYAWVGISTQRIGVEGGEPPLQTPLGFSIPLKLINILRYATLSHPGDSFSYDIFSQAARAIRNPVGEAPLGDLQGERLIAAGESQSATRLLTYANAFEPTEDLFDGYFIHSRLGFIPDFGGASAPLSQAPQEYITTPEVVTVRDDLGKPVLNLQTETDLFKLGAYSSRQPDSPGFRLWEVAGTAHADLYLTTAGGLDQGKVAAAKIYETYNPSLVMGFCPDPINTAPQHHFVGHAALHALNQWLINGTPPPSAPRLLVNASEDAIERDSLGNAIGGVRSPYMDVPVALMSGDNSSEQNESDICFLFGETRFFDRATLNSLYAGKAHYVAAVTDSALQAVADGYLMAEDADLIIAAAEATTLFDPE